jgi:hypothetical protein
VSGQLQAEDGGMLRKGLLARPLQGVSWVERTAVCCCLCAVCCVGWRAVLLLLLAKLPTFFLHFADCIIFDDISRMLTIYLDLMDMYIELGACFVINLVIIIVVVVGESLILFVQYSCTCTLFHTPSIN